jgi:hypothetical protein
VTSRPSGVGNGLVEYTVDPNTTGSARRGFLAIAGQTFAVTQSGSTSCTYAISPTTARLPQPGGIAIVDVIAPAQCAWTAVSDSPWLVITAGASGTGNGRVIYAASRYIGRASNRKGSITVATLTLPVTQAR